jgi:hypothetical protein
MNSGQSALSGRRLWVWPSTAGWCSSGAALALFSVRPDGRGKPASTVFTAFHAYGGGTEGWPTAAGPGVAKDIEVYTHYGHEGGVDYQVDWQLSWFVECFPDQG